MVAQRAAGAAGQLPLRLAGREWRVLETDWASELTLVRRVGQVQVLATLSKADDPRLHPPEGGSELLSMYSTRVLTARWQPQPGGLTLDVRVVLPRTSEPGGLSPDDHADQRAAQLNEILPSLQGQLALGGWPV